jgi:hypothetical protein
MQAGETDDEESDENHRDDWQQRITTERVVALGREELTDIVDVCDIEA